MEGAAGLQSPPPKETKFKERKFCSYDDMKSVTWFTVQLQSAMEIYW